MKILVDEMPEFKEECPFCKRDWSSQSDLPIYECDVTLDECNLGEEKYECHGLKQFLIDNTEKEERDDS